MWSCHQLLKEFAAGKPDAVRGLIPIGEELAGIGSDIPFFTDPEATSSGAPGAPRRRSRDKRTRGDGSCGGEVDGLKKLEVGED
jgi:hypothetical protein